MPTSPCLCPEVGARRAFEMLHNRECQELISRFVSRLRQMSFETQPQPAFQLIEKQHKISRLECFDHLAIDLIALGNRPSLKRARRRQEMVAKFGLIHGRFYLKLNNGCVQFGCTMSVTTRQTW